MSLQHELQDSDMTRCIANCLASYRGCLEAAYFCGDHVNYKMISLLNQCADACHLAVRNMIANSEFHPQSCELCFEVCTRCAEECARFEEDEIMRQCAANCRRSAESCRGMAGMMAKVRKEQMPERPYHPL